MGIHVAASKCPGVHAGVVESVLAALRAIIGNRQKKYHKIIKKSNINIIMQTFVIFECLHFLYSDIKKNNKWILPRRTENVN